MQIIDLFSGIGGFSLAGSWVGWRTIQFCEIDEWCQKVLRKHWADVPIHTDIHTLSVEQIKNNGLYNENETTIVTAGVPCQPWSHAGRRKGKEDDRNLWPQSLAFVKTFKPDWCLFENVPGFVNWGEGMVFESVLLELESFGYEVIPIVIAAAGVGAWHRRDRIWVLAHALNDSDRTFGGAGGKAEGLSEKHRKERQSRQPGRTGQSVPESIGKDSVSDGRLFGKSEQGRTILRTLWDTSPGGADGLHPEEGTKGSIKGLASDSEREGLEGHDEHRPRLNRQDEGIQPRTEGSGTETERQGRKGSRGNRNIDSNSKGKGTGRIRNEGEEKGTQGGNELSRVSGGTSSIRQDVPNSKSVRLQHSTQTLNIREVKGKTQKKRSKSSDALETNIHPGERQGSFESRLGRVVDGLSYWMDEPEGIPRVTHEREQRVARLKGLGNSIVPQVAYMLYKVIDSYEHT